MPRRAASSAISAKGHFQILVNIITQRFERGDINDFSFVGEFSGAGRTYQTVQTDEKGGQRLAGAGRSGDQHIAPGANLGPSQNLWLGGSAKPGDEPFRDQGIEGGKRAMVDLRLGEHLSTYCRTGPLPTLPGRLRKERSAPFVFA